MLGDIEVDVLFVELRHLDDGLTGVDDLPRFDFQRCYYAIPVGCQLGIRQLIDRVAQLGFERRRPFSRRGVGGLWRSNSGGLVTFCANSSRYLATSSRKKSRSATAEASCA
jgi:hypothetical protein